MKAMRCHHWGKPEDLVYEEGAEPLPGPGQVLLRVQACALNFADSLLIAGQYQERPSLPFSPGAEVAGQVLALGPGVSGWQVGQLVAAYCGTGGMAEQAVVDAGNLLPVPAGMDAIHAAAFPIAYGTAHLALAHRARLQPGETLLVHGAAGGVGLAAVEVGKRLGATVIATAGNQEKLDLARAHGADHLINYREGPFREPVKALTGGRGADVIFDPVGGDVFDQSLRCINWEGRLLVIGFASGRIPQAPANYILVKNVSVVGVYWGGYLPRNADLIARSLASLLGWYQEGWLRPHVCRTFPLEQAVEAIHYLLSRQATGKVVLTVG